MNQNPQSNQIICEVNPQNILEWHFILKNFQYEPYIGGFYHGKIIIPQEYPLKPPNILFVTPNGKFQPGQKICLSFTGFHPESWSPMWTIETMLIGVISFMYTDQQTSGSIQASEGQKKQMAKESLQFNLKNPDFRQIFKRHLENLDKDLPQQEVIQNAPEQNQPIYIEENQSLQKNIFIVGGVIAIVMFYIVFIID
ncbi:hypothetical protein pb186bvf_002383 [Paramecium bursaria]